MTSDPLIADLIRACDASALADGIGMTLDPWQADVLTSGHPRILLNCARQSGKSEVAALLSLHAALYEPGSTVLLLSPSMRQSAELFRRVLSIYRTLGRPVVATSENALSLALENGSRVIALPSTDATIRGYSKVTLLCVDEASRVPDPIVAAIRPMLAVSSGRIVALSTPHGQRGWWWRAWTEDPDWLKVSVTAAQNPRITAEWLAAERASMANETMFEQEYFCSFAGGSAERVFSAESVKEMFTSSFKPLFGDDDNEPDSSD